MSKWGARWWAAQRFTRAGALALVTVVALGCNRQPQTDPLPAPISVPTRVLVVGDELLGEAIQRHWNARSDESLELTSAQPAELMDRQTVAADVIVYPSWLLGSLAERRWLQPLDNKDVEVESFAASEWLPLQRTAEVTWGDQIHAFSLGSPQLQLVYRIDLLEEVGADLPQTWAELSELVQQLRGASSAYAVTPCVQPLADHWAGLVLLARAASGMRDQQQLSGLFDTASFRPLIDRPPFVESLQQMMADAGDEEPAGGQLSPRQAVQAVLTGRAAVAFGWPTRDDSSDLDSAELVSGEKIGFAELPGSPRFYDIRGDEWRPHEAEESMRVPLIATAGRLVSMTRNVRQKRSALAVMHWLVSKEAGPLLSPLSSATTMYRIGHLERAQSWLDGHYGSAAPLQYGDTLQEANSRPLAVPALRIPHRDRYLTLLSDAVRRALRGEVGAAAALKEAAQKWDAVSEEVGRQEQRRAYLRSLGLNAS